MYKQSLLLASAAEVARPIEMTGTTPDAVKDAGRVRIGNGMLRFTTTKASDAIRDAGRVRVGNGMLRF